jgi:hypothetical protein
LDKVSVKKREIARNFICHDLSTRECGIATYSQDLILALKKNSKHFIKIAALEMQNNTYSYTDEVTYFFGNG